MAIAIKTRLADGIYRSCGGGEIRTSHEWTTGPRNLLRAIAQLRSTRRSNIDGYGRTWLEIDGVAIDDAYLSDIAHRHKYDQAPPTKKARDAIELVRSGEYADYWLARVDAAELD